MDVALVVVAGLFAVFCGANDGGSLLATSLKVTSMRPLAVAVLLSGMAVLVPLLFGTQVAITLAERLVSFQPSDGRVALLIAVLGATAVVVLLSTRGLPTSLTLALIGGLVGVGVGGDLPVAWGWVLVVLLISAAAPLVGMAAATLLSMAWRLPRMSAAVRDVVRHAHRVGVVAQAFAYGSNDAQKMLAVFAVAMPAVPNGRPGAAPVWLLPVIGVLFCLGTLLGVRRYATRLSSGVLAVTPVQSVTAQLSSALVVTGAAVAGSPVSMTQAVVGGLVGAGVLDGVRRIRWQHAVAIVTAWVLTLPLTGLLTAATIAVVVRV